MPDRVFSSLARANYGDRSDDTTYEGSGIYTNVWNTDFGRFGIMANYAYSHVKTQTEGVIMQRIGTFCSGGNTDADGGAIVAADGSIPCTSTPYGGSDWQYMPSQVNYSQVLYDRVRTGLPPLLQFESNDKTVVATCSTWIRSTTMRGSSAAPIFHSSACGRRPRYSPQTQRVHCAGADGTPAFTFRPDGMLAIRRADAADR